MGVGGEGVVRESSGSQEPASQHVWLSTVARMGSGSHWQELPPDCHCLHSFLTSLECACQWPDALGNSRFLSWWFLRLLKYILRLPGFFFCFFVVFSCPWEVTSCRHVCFSPRLHASVPCCSVVTGVRRTVRKNPKALGSWSSSFLKLGYTWG